MKKLKIQNQLLIWARARTGLDEKDFGKKCGTTAERVINWEKEGEVTFTQIEKIAAAAKIPSGYLFLTTPPVEVYGLTDFRTVENQPLRSPSPKLAKTILETKNRQNWLSEYKRNQGQSKLDYISSISLRDPIDVAARRIISALKIGRQISKGQSKISETITAHIKAIEAKGINVIKSSYCGGTKDLFDPNEFRGFALSDEYAPFIFVNAADALVGQLFTLIHEVVHIFLGMSGVDGGQVNSLPSNEVERFCNRVAAEILVPSNAVLAFWKSDPDPVVAAKNIAVHCKVSGAVVAIKLFHDNLIDFDDSVSLAQELKLPRREKSKGGTYYNTAPYRIGIGFGKALFASTAEGTTPFNDAMRLSGIKTESTFKELAKRMIGADVFA